MKQPLIIIIRSINFSRVNKERNKRDIERNKRSKMVSSASSSEAKIISQCFVKPKTVSETSKDPYNLSPMDHVMLSFQYIQKGLLFLKPSDGAIKPQDFMETLLQKLKDSLATALVHFYLLSGRLSTSVTDDASSYSVFVDCNNSSGAGFIHAKSDLSVGDIVGSKYVPLVVQSFFDHHNEVKAKVTELVDGVFVGLSMNHSIGDGVSFWHFFNSLSEIFSSQETIDNNIKLFCLKNPPILRQVSTGSVYSLPFSESPKSNPQFQTQVLQERMLHFSSEAVRSLKSKANQESGTTTMISSLQSLTAFIWRSITRARKLQSDQETTCRFVADSRPRMVPPLPMNYFGVYISLVKTTAKVGNLLENEFGWAASKLHHVVVEHTGEKICSEMKRRFNPPCALPSETFYDPTIVHMGNSPRYDNYGCQFGMGKAVAVRSGNNDKYDGKVSAYPGREGGGSIDLEVCLLPEFMEALESDQEFMSPVSPSSG
ncbi:BnaAnng06340D [Brassica napus]|uniref:BnaAnng06340D protein n=1 Tax=Brassica napus TaxID=3708 RepID=A0A078HSQ6_BRANA|nr:BnaAnng06340D [Brassica napus]